MNTNTMIPSIDQMSAAYGNAGAISVPTVVEPTIVVSTRAHVVFARGLASKRSWTSGPRRT